MPVFDFNTPQTVDALGSAISGISEEILRNIEVTIKKYEREKLSERSYENDRTDLYPQRGLLDSQSEPVPAGEQAPGQVRENAEEVSTGASPGAVEPPDPVGAAVPPSAGDRRDSEQAVGADDAGTDEIDGSNGGYESQRPDEVGGADEQPERPGRRSDPDGADLRLTEDPPVEQFSFFPTEAQQIESIAEAERVQTAPSAFSMFISQADIDHFLRTGGNEDDARTRIVSEFSKQKSLEDRAAFLRALYHGGNGLITENGKISAWYGEDGIHIASGDTARYLPSAQVIRWADAAERTEKLLDNGAFATNLEVTEAYRNERQHIATEAHLDDMVLYQVGDFFEMYGEDARQAELLLDLNLTSRNIPDVGRVTMCGIPAHSLEQYVEKLRDKYDVTIAATQEDSNERRIYTLPSIDHKAENAINAYGAEFGADGTSVFRDPAAEQPHQPTVRELFDRYKLAVGNALSKDTAFVNACRNSDRQNAYLEGADAIRRIVTASDNLQLVRLYFDMPAFHNRLHQELLEELYPTLATTVAPSPYKVTQEDIDDALQKWNGNPQSKQAVVRYMEQHGREKDTALWLAKEYGAGDTSQPLQISVGNSEPVILSWSKVQRRLAQLIHEDHFFTEQEKPTLEQNPDYRLLDRLRADCEYFLGAGNHAEKHLWAGSVWAQIAKMRELYDTLPEKPEWLTKEAIDDYAERMALLYQVVAYHHFENGFDDKMGYQTLAEAEKAAQGYVDGTMESDGFAYDGAAIYDRQTRKYLRVYGNYPDERAQAEAAGRDWVEESAVSTESTIAPADRFHVVSLDHGFYTRYSIWDDKADGYYVDSDGVTKEFTSEWQAEEYRLKLQEQALMEQAKELISDFCQSEYGSEADFSDPTKIGIAYTTITDDEIPIQVNIDLVNFRLERYLSGEHLETRQYGSLQYLIANELEILDFSDLVHVPDEDIEQYRWRKGEGATEKATETVESAPSTQKGNLSYSVGDTVYLDNKPFEITEVGLFDVHLRDPSQTYPIFRVESKERLPALLRRDARNAHLFAAEAAEQEPPVTKPAAFYSADKTHLPYDIETPLLRPMPVRR